MSAALALSAPDVEPVPERPSLLRFLTCGSVDDGKSTLLGRLLFDSNAVLDDQLATLDSNSRRFGTHGQNRDFALLIDGLSAEREQGITIDVAYRYFSTAKRAFIVADTPGHEQYTRNMATGASNAELAIILVDARKGILPQTRRHSYIVSMLGVRHVVLAVNKMDLVGFAPDAWRRIVDEYRAVVAPLGFAEIVPIPICAREGDNVAGRSPRTPWYRGPSLLEHLETVAAVPEPTDRLFRFPVQWVNRPNADFRGYAGTITMGTVHAGDAVRVLPGGHAGRIALIATADGDRDRAIAGQAVTLTLTGEVDVSRGDTIVAANDTLRATETVVARLLWMDEAPLGADRGLIVRLGSGTANARVARLHHAIDIHGFAAKPAETLAMNEISLADVVFDKPLAAAPYAGDRTLGAFVLIDRMTNATVALGVVETVPGAAPDAPTEPAARPPAQSRHGWVPRIVGWADDRRGQVNPTLASRLLRAVAMLALVLALSGNLRLAVIVAAAEIVLSPLLARVVRAIWAWGPAPDAATREA